MTTAREQSRSSALEYGVVAFLAAIGVMTSVILASYLGQIAHGQRQETMLRQATAHAEAMAEAIDRYEMLARALAGLFATTQPVGRGDFQAFTANLVRGAPGVQAVAWLPRVPTDKRHDLEDAARAEGLTDFEVRPGPGGDLLNPELFPVYFIEPMLANEAALGVDAASMRDRQRTLQDARDNGRTAATGRLELVQNRGSDRAGIILFTPVYTGGRVPDGLVERRALLRGFVAVSLDLQQLMQDALRGTRTDVYVYDGDAPPERGLLHWAPSPMTGTLRQPLPQAAVLANPHIVETLTVGGRTWSLVMPLEPGTEMPLAAWASLVGGLLLTGLLTALALGVILRRRRAENWAAAISRSNEGLWREIAERRRIEAALRETGDRLQLAIKTAPLSLFAQDLQLRYTWLFKSRLGLGPEEALGRRDEDLMPAADAALLTGIKRQVLETGQGCRQEVQLHGLTRPAVLDLVVEPMYEPNGAIVGIIGTAIDITDERESQAQLERARAEAERANQAKSRFLAAASHDLRQPLQAARLFIEVLKLRLDDHPARPIVDKVMTALEATDGLLNSLLDISTLEAGVVTPEITAVGLRPMLERLGVETLAQAESKGLRFTMVPSDLWVGSDPVLLERMLRNLLANALRYTERGGVLLGCRRVGDAVRVTVCDTGPGIPADKLEIIFEDFYQIGNQERDRAQGLGLGLSVVQRTARLLDHRIGVTSRLGHGSCFWVELPAVQPAAEASRVVLSAS